MQKLYEKSDIEIQRYKQDCRKKAFESAWNEKLTLLQQGNNTTFDIESLANNYYNWLTVVAE